MEIPHEWRFEEVPQRFAHRSVRASERCPARRSRQKSVSNCIDYDHPAVLDLEAISRRSRLVAAQARGLRREKVFCRISGNHAYRVGLADSLATSISGDCLLAAPELITIEVHEHD